MFKYSLYLLRRKLRLEELKYPIHVAPGAGPNPGGGRALRNAGASLQGQLMDTLREKLDQTSNAKVGGKSQVGKRNNIWWATGQREGQPRY